MTLTVVWLLLGSALCTLELFLPTAFVEFAMGISAFVVALISLVVPQFGLQVLLWMIVSLVLVWLSRRLLPSQRKTLMFDATEAETLTEIQPGKTGRVLYEGNSWQARCEDVTLAIQPNEKIYVVGRQGTTLLVMPTHLVHHP